MFIILETQTNANGTVSTIITQFSDKDQAESKYHQILASAAVSSLPKHTAFMLTDEGYVLKSECYRHETVTQPNPEEIPE